MAVPVSSLDVAQRATQKIQPSNFEAAKEERETGLSAC